MLKVAIAEDDFRIAQVQERFLQEIENVKVVGKALNAKEAIEMLEQEPIDLLILDIYMPDEMGTDLLPRIRERFPEVDVIVVTAATERDILERCLRNGVVNYLIKPVKMESFIEAIEGYQKKEACCKLEMKWTNRLLIRILAMISSSRQWKKSYHLELTVSR